MTAHSNTHKYIYAFNYDFHHSELCKLESRQLFDKEEANKLLFSNVKVDPSISPFIKNRFETILSSENFPELIQNIKNKNIHIDGFKVEYLLLDGDATDDIERRKKLKDIGYSIVGDPDFNNPSITYATCFYENIWYFGVTVKAKTDWRQHKTKPYSFSNSICMIIGKTLVSMASKGDKTNSLLDACCGVGTVMLEARSSEFNIEGNDINPKACNHTSNNLKHYKYTAKVHCTDVKDLNHTYDAAIVDLPYNLFSYSTDTITFNIIKSTTRLAPRIIIVSISDIAPLIKKSGLTISDFGTVGKRGKSKFTRNIWVCEKEPIPTT